MLFSKLFHNVILNEMLCGSSFDLMYFMETIVLICVKELYSSTFSN